MSPHISAEVGQIAKTVILPGDPLRAKYLAERYLENPVLVSSVRNMNMYTGTYKGKPVSICCSGMGVGSAGIITYELFHDYGVENIIRVGTTGALADIPVGTLFIASESFAFMTDYTIAVDGKTPNIAYPSPELNKKLEESAKRQGIPITYARVHTTNTYYFPHYTLEEMVKRTGCDMQEMEAFVIFYNAQYFGKHAAAVLTVSDNCPKEIYLSAEEREKCVFKSTEVALGIL